MSSGDYPLPAARADLKHASIFMPRSGRSAQRRSSKPQDQSHFPELRSVPVIQYFRFRLGFRFPCIRQTKQLPNAGLGLSQQGRVLLINHQDQFPIGLDFL
jgi:hypothetical protein